MTVNKLSLQVFEVIERASSAKTKAEKIKILRDYESWALKDVLRGAYDAKVQWLLPAGVPPYEANDAHNHPSNLYKQHKQFTYFVKGGRGDSMVPFKREVMFIRMLEAVHPKEAELLLKMKDKKQLAKGITKKLVQEVYPDLIRE